MGKLIKFCGIVFIVYLVIGVSICGFKEFHQYLHKDDVHYVKDMLEGSKIVHYTKVTSDGRVLEESSLKFDTASDALKYYSMD